MSKTLAIMLTATLAVAVATATTTMQIQPAYSQASHCVEQEPPGQQPGTTCITPGQNPVETFCPPSGMDCRDTSLTHQEAGQAIGQQYLDCAQGTATGCTVEQR